MNRTERRGGDAAGVEIHRGGAERDRTADLLIANEALSQLSYSPNRVFAPLWAQARRLAM